MPLPTDIAAPKVLIIDDRPGDMRWLIRRLEDLGCEIHLETDEKAARSALRTVREQQDRYVAGIFDIMVATMDLETLMEMDDDIDLEKDVLDPAIDTGLRLIDYAREELGLSPETFPIAAISARDDSELNPALKKRGVPRFRRDVESSHKKSIMKFIEDKVRPRDST